MNVRLLIDGNTILVSNTPPRRGEVNLRNQRLDATAMRGLRQMLAAELGAAALKLTDQKVLEEAAKRLASKRWTQIVADSAPLMGRSAGAETAKPTNAEAKGGSGSGSGSGSGKGTGSGSGSGTGSSSGGAGTGTGGGAAKEPDLTWIEIQIVDEDGQPLVGETYEFSNTDGAVAKGTTSGAALRGEQIPPGKCKLKLPDLHKNGWTGHGKAR
jgi:hypothetical protein